MKNNCIKVVFTLSKNKIVFLVVIKLKFFHIYTNLCRKFQVSVLLLHQAINSLSHEKKNCKIRVNFKHTFLYYKFVHNNIGNRVRQYKKSKFQYLDAIGSEISKLLTCKHVNSGLWNSCIFFLKLQPYVYFTASARILYFNRV